PGMTVDFLGLNNMFNRLTYIINRYIVYPIRLARWEQVNMPLNKAQGEADNEGRGAEKALPVQPADNTGNTGPLGANVTTRTSTEEAGGLGVDMAAPVSTEGVEVFGQHERILRNGIGVNSNPRSPPAGVADSNGALGIGVTRSAPDKLVGAVVANVTSSEALDSVRLADARSATSGDGERGQDAEKAAQRAVAKTGSESRSGSIIGNTIARIFDRIGGWVSAGLNAGAVVIKAARARLNGAADEAKKSQIEGSIRASGFSSRFNKVFIFSLAVFLTPLTALAGNGRQFTGDFKLLVAGLLVTAAVILAKPLFSANFVKFAKRVAVLTLAGVLYLGVAFVHDGSFGLRHSIVEASSVGYSRTATKDYISPAGYFMGNGRPAALIIENGNILNPLNTQARVRGGALFVVANNGRSFVTRIIVNKDGLNDLSLTLGAWDLTVRDVRIGIQAGPMAIEAGRVTEDAKKYRERGAKNIVFVDSNGNIGFISQRSWTLGRRGVSAERLAQEAVNRGAMAGMFVDGGSTGRIYKPAAGVFTREPVAPQSNAGKPGTGFPLASMAVIPLLGVFGFGKRKNEETDRATENNSVRKNVSEKDLDTIINKFDAVISGMVKELGAERLAQRKAGMFITDYLLHGKIETDNQALLELAKDIGALSNEDLAKLSTDPALAFLSAVVAVKAETKAEKAETKAEKAETKAEENRDISLAKLSIAKEALKSMGYKNCATTTADIRIREALENARLNMGGTWTASEFIQIHNRLVAEYNAKHEEGVESISPALVTAARLIELIGNNISVRIIEKLDNGNLHVVLPLDINVDKVTGKISITAVNGNIEGANATRIIDLENLNFTGKGIIILVQDRNSDSIKDTERLSNEQLDLLTEGRSLLGNSGSGASGQGGSGNGSGSATGDVGGNGSDGSSANAGNAVDAKEQSPRLTSGSITAGTASTVKGTAFDPAHSSRAPPAVSEIISALYSLVSLLNSASLIDKTVANIIHAAAASLESEALAGSLNSFAANLIQVALLDKAVRREDDDYLVALLKNLMKTVKSRGLGVHGRYFRAARLIAYRFGLPYTSMIQLGTALMLLNETEEFIQALKEEDLVRAELEVKKQDLAPAANKLAVVLYPSKSSDHNGALADLLDLVEELQGRGYEVRYTRVHTVVDLASGLLRYTQDRPADLVIIGGHGNPSSILLSPEGGLGYGVLGINDVNELAALNFVLAQQGVILLNSCSTGNGGVSGNNIANAFANAFPQASRILAPYSPAGPRLVFDADNILVDIRYDDSSSGGVVSSVNMKTGKFNPETNLTRSGYDAAGAQGRSVPVAPASAGSQALPVDQGQARSGTVPLASLGDSPSQNNIIVKAFRSLVAGLRSYFANARKAINEKSGLAKVRLAEVFESSTPTLAPPLVRLATWAANVGRRVNALIKGGINGNTERNDGRDKDAGDAVSGSGAKGTQESRSTGFVGRSGDTSTGFGAVVGALSESHSLPSNDLSVVNHSGRAPPVSAIIITAAIIFFLSVLLSKVFGQDNQAIINLIQPAIDPSVAGNQLTANVVKGGAGALLQGLTPLVAAFTTIIGGVTCALLKSKRLRSNISLISLRRTLHLWLQGKTATTILEYSSFITILAPFI
ncbi:MAG: hypothetical protein PHS12_05805, partial [Candidatus Omnitrophica bacterium]|nr:hypothetical protein [Candidatus Omnitrophota bacterium]